MDTLSLVRTAHQHNDALGDFLETEQRLHAEMMRLQPLAIRALCTRAWAQKTIDLRAYAAGTQVNLPVSSPMRGSSEDTLSQRVHIDRRSADMSTLAENEVARALGRHLQQRHALDTQVAVAHDQNHRRCDELVEEVSTALVRAMALTAVQRRLASHKGEKLDVEKDLRVNLIEDPEERECAVREVLLEIAHDMPPPDLTLIESETRSRVSFGGAPDLEALHKMREALKKDIVERRPELRNTLRVVARMQSIRLVLRALAHAQTQLRHYLHLVTEATDSQLQRSSWLHDVVENVRRSVALLESRVALALPAHATVFVQRLLNDNIVSGSSILAMTDQLCSSVQAGEATEAYCEEVADMLRRLLLHRAVCRVYAAVVHNPRVSNPYDSMGNLPDLLLATTQSSTYSTLVQFLIHEMDMVLAETIEEARPLIEQATTIMHDAEAMWRKVLTETIPARIADLELKVTKLFYEWVEHMPQHLEHGQRIAFAHDLHREVKQHLNFNSHRILSPVVRQYLLPVWKHWQHPGQTYTDAVSGRAVHLNLTAQSVDHESFESRVREFVEHPSLLSYTRLVDETIEHEHTQNTYSYWCSVWLTVQIIVVCRIFGV